MVTGFILRPLNQQHNSSAGLMAPRADEPAGQLGFEEPPAGLSETLLGRDEVERRLAGNTPGWTVRPALLALLWRHRLTTDLFRPLSGEAILCRQP